MAVDYKTYSGWSSGMQKRYRERYGSAPQQPYTPFQLPTSPPPGSYDPALDAQQRAQERGYGDLQASDATNSLYAGQDYQTGVSRENTSYANTLADIATGRTRSNEDFATGTGRVNEDYTRGTSRSNEDYGTATGNLVRAFGQLGQAQRGNIAAAGLGGGALRQALARRTENQGIQQKGLDTSHTRSLEDLTTGKSRSLQDLGTAHDRSLQDYSTGETRAGTAHENSLADILTGYTRGQATQATQEAIAGRELGFGTQDINAEKTYAAQGAGWDPTAGRPPNEYSHGGVTYRKVGGQRYLPSGQQVSLKKIRSMYR
jgi:hypothetical protein